MSKRAVKLSKEQEHEHEQNSSQHEHQTTTMYRIQQSPLQTSTTSQQSPIAVGVTSTTSRPVALSISVTTASHPNPPVPSPRLSIPASSRITSSSPRLAAKGGITLPLPRTGSNSNGVMSTATTLHQQQTSSASSASPVTSSSSSSRGITLPRGVQRVAQQQQKQQPLHQQTPPSRGITLPAGVTRHGNIAAAIASGQQQQLQRRPVVTISSGPRASLAGSGGITLQQRLQSVPPTEPSTTAAAQSAAPTAPRSAFNKNGVYSSAGRASVTAHQQIAARRINSAPGNLAVIAASASKGAAKHTYRKVVGGKPSVPRTMSLVRTHTHITCLLHGCYPKHKSPALHYMSNSHIFSPFSCHPKQHNHRRSTTTCLLKYSSTGSFNPVDTVLKTFAASRVVITANQRCCRKLRMAFD